MKDCPILFTGPMVRALLDGSKTQTRRVVKPQPQMITDQRAAPWEGAPAALLQLMKQAGKHCPHGQPSNRLWVRENGWERPERTAKMMREGADTWEPYYFDADGLSEQEATDFKAWGFKRRPSIHMPRWASRIILEITDVRVERLQYINEADAIAEGIKISVDAVTGKPLVRISGKYPPACYINRHSLPIAEYASLWDTINGRGCWALNPWVWVVEFKRIEP